MSAKDFLAKVDNYDETLEANLTTMMQSLRSSKKFWFLKKRLTMHYPTVGLPYIVSDIQLC